MRGVFLKDLELRRVTINSHIFLVIDVLFVNKSYCALGHTWYHHWWWGNCDDELLAQAYGQGRPEGAHSQCTEKIPPKSAIYGEYGWSWIDCVKFAVTRIHLLTHSFVLVSLFPILAHCSALWYWQANKMLKMGLGAYFVLIRCN